MTESLFHYSPLKTKLYLEIHRPSALMTVRHAGILFGGAVVPLILFVTGCGQQPTSQSASAPANPVTQTSCGMNMVTIPGGQFLMGNNDGAIDTKPAHQVKLDGFFMDQHEVT